MSLFSEPKVWARVQQFQNWANLVAQEAGLPDSGVMLAAALRARSQGHPWATVDYSLADVAERLRYTAERARAIAERYITWRRDGVPFILHAA